MPTNVFTPDMGDDAVDLNQQFLSPAAQFKAAFINLTKKDSSVLHKIGQVYKKYEEELVNARLALLQLNKSIEALKSKLLQWGKDPQTEGQAQYYRDLMGTVLKNKVKVEFSLKQHKAMGIDKRYIEQGRKGLQECRKSFLSLDKQVQKLITESVPNPIRLNVATEDLDAKIQNQIKGPKGQRLLKNIGKKLTGKNDSVQKGELKDMVMSTLPLADDIASLLQDIGLDNNKERSILSEKICKIIQHLELTRSYARSLNERNKEENKNRANKQILRLEESKKLEKLESELKAVTTEEEKTRLERTVASHRRAIMQLDGYLNARNRFHLAADVAVFKESLIAFEIDFNEKQKTAFLLEYKEAKSDLDELIERIYSLLHQGIFFLATFDRPPVVSDEMVSDEEKKIDFDQFNERLESIETLSEEQKNDAAEFLNILKEQAELSKNVGDNREAIEFLQNISQTMVGFEERLTDSKKYNKKLTRANELVAEVEALFAQIQAESTGEANLWFPQFLKAGQSQINTARLLHKGVALNPTKTMDKLLVVKTAMETILSQISQAKQNMLGKFFAEYRREVVRVEAKYQETTRELSEMKAQTMDQQRIQEFEKELEKINTFITRAKKEAPSNPNKAVRLLTGHGSGFVEGVKGFFLENALTCLLYLEEDLEVLDTSIYFDNSAEEVVIQSVDRDGNLAAPKYTSSFVHEDRTEILVQPYSVKIKYKILDLRRIAEIFEEIEALKKLDYITNDSYELNQGHNDMTYLNIHKSDLERMIRFYGNVPKGQLEKRLQDTILSVYKKRIESELASNDTDEQKNSNIEAHLVQAQKDIDDFIHAQIAYGQKLVVSASQQEMKDAMKVVALGVSIVSKVTRLVLSGGLDLVAWVGLVGDVIGLVLFVKDKLVKLGERLLEATEVMLQLHRNMKNTVRGIITAELLSFTPLSEIVSSVKKVQPILLKLRAALNDAQQGLNENTIAVQRLFRAMDKAKKRAKEIKKMPKSSLQTEEQKKERAKARTYTAAIGHLESALNTSLILISTQVVELEQVFAFVEKSDSDIEMYQSRLTSILRQTDDKSMMLDTISFMNDIRMDTTRVLNYDASGNSVITQFEQVKDALSTFVTSIS